MGVPIYYPIYYRGILTRFNRIALNGSILLMAHAAGTMSFCHFHGIRNDTPSSPTASRITGMPAPRYSYTCDAGPWDHAILDIWR